MSIIDDMGDTSTKSNFSATSWQEQVIIFNDDVSFALDQHT
jgi:hypothetical protein